LIYSIIAVQVLKTR